jgi:hypothetical protein
VPAARFEFQADQSPNAPKQDNSSSFLFKGKAATALKKRTKSAKTDKTGTVESTLTAEQDETETG